MQKTGTASWRRLSLPSTHAKRMVISGVALVPRREIETELAAGRLVAPWPDGMPISKTFCLILPAPIRLSEGPIRAFANWRVKEARSSWAIS
ncbi:hypothetical protein [Xanthobacter sp. NM-25]|uniref:hypothetical protein n=1 Tax=Xanthobacter sp. NM-25 TaxID=2744465 RepID=UPI001EE02EE3|nr:hypothetical protein [Xanthobacter sp. NM-25]